MFKDRTEKTLQINKLSWIETEREKAIQKTINQFDKRKEKFLWSTDLKFEKRRVCYQMIAQMKNAPNVLVLTTKENALSSWWKDFAKFMRESNSRVFVSENSALAKYTTVYSREEYRRYILNTNEENEKEMFAVDSAKGVMESVYFGGKKDKLKWMTTMEFDLVIVDQEQSAIDQNQVYKILHKIHRKHTLYLRNINSNRIEEEGFSEEQVFFFPSIVQKELKRAGIKTSIATKKSVETEKALKKTSFFRNVQKKEKEFIEEIEKFARQKIAGLNVEDKGARYTFTDKNQVMGDVVYAWMWFIKSDGKLIFRYKFDQNEKNAENYKDNQIIVNEMHLKTIKNIIELLVWKTVII